MRQKRSQRPTCSKSVLFDNKLGFVDDMNKPVLMLRLEMLRALRLRALLGLDTYKLGDLRVSWKLFWRQK